MELPHDIILHIFTFLEDKEVILSTSTCLHWRESLSDQLWRARILRPSNDKTKLTSSQLATADNTWMQLCGEMNGIFSNPIGLIKKAHMTSSTDFDQVLSHTLLNNKFYWSSRMNHNEDSDEYVIYKLCNPLCVISSLSVLPYQATWQRGLPVYAPKMIKISIGFTPEKMHYTSQLFPMVNVHESQLVVLEEPQFGRYVRLDLIGRQQRQPGNEAWYTALQHVRVIGTHAECFEDKVTFRCALLNFYLEKTGKRLPKKYW